MNKTSQKLRVFESFSGIGSQVQALKNIGVDCEVVATSEIDKFAIVSYASIHNNLIEELNKFEDLDVETMKKKLESKGVEKPPRNKNKLKQLYVADKLSNNLGDISKIEVDNIPDHDLFTYSFPCQDISIAGNQGGLDEGGGTRSSLLWECQKVISGKKPKYLLMENVKNLVSKRHKHNFDKWLEWLEVQDYNNYWKVLNAKNFGVPQNRERVFVVSIRKDVDNGKFEFEEGYDMGVRLKDILECSVDKGYYMDDNRITEALSKNMDKENSNNIGRLGLIDIRGMKQIRTVYDKNGISPTLDTMQGGHRQPKILESNKILKYDIKLPVRVRRHDVDTKSLVEILKESKGKCGLTNREIAESLNVPITKVEHWFRRDSSFSIPDKNIWLELKSLLKIDTDLFDKPIMEFEERDGVYEKSNRVYDSEGISPTLTSASADETILEPNESKNENPIYVDSSVKPSVSKNFEREKDEILKSDKEIYQCECESGWQDNKIGLRISPTLRASNNHTCALDSSYRIRKLTPTECWRLMGFKDEDINKCIESGISNSQLYKQAGNSIVIPVLESIFRKLLLK